MEKSNEIFVKGGFYCKNSLLEQVPELPCSRVVNGFRLIPEWLDDAHLNYVWFILPNHSSMRFYFRSLRFAQNFANSFKNNHSDAFWYNRWIPVYSKQNVIKLFPLNFYEN